MKPWLTDIRKTALVAAIAAISGAAYQMKPVHQMALATLTRIPWFFYPVLGLVYIVLAIPSLGFLVVLYRSNVPLRISIRLRRLALLAAAVSTLELLWSLVTWAQFYWRQFQWPSATSAILAALNSLWAVAYILFLVAIFRHPDDSPISDTGNGRFLRRMAKISVVFWSLVLVGIVAAAIYLAIDFDYPHYRVLARLYGLEIPSLGSDLIERARYFLEAALLMVPSYIVHRSLRAKREVVEIPSGST